MSDLEKNRDFWIEIDGEPVRAREGAILGRLLEKRGGLSMPCAGMGRCGKCRVYVDGRVSPPKEAERRLLGEKELAQGIRLACRPM